MNTVVVMLNDQASDWPEDMRRAMQRRDQGAEATHFSTGRVISTAHADHMQITATRGNTGTLLSPTLPASQKELNALAEILKGHGYTIRRPGRTRGEGPLCWGYAAEQDRLSREAADLGGPDQEE